MGGPLGGPYMGQPHHFIHLLYPLAPMCDGPIPRIAIYTFMIAGTLSPLVSIVGAKLWPQRAGRVALASLALFVVAGIAGAFVMLC